MNFSRRISVTCNRNSLFRFENTQLQHCKRTVKSSIHCQNSNSRRQNVISRFWRQSFKKPSYWHGFIPIFKSVVQKSGYKLVSVGTGLGVVLFSFYGLDINRLPGILSPVHAGLPWAGQFNFIADIIKSVGSAVVFVEIKGKHPNSGKRVTLANGSGFIVRGNGLILTNAHVVENKSRVTVKLYDGTNFDGVVTVVDPVSDLAIIQINPDKKLPVIPLCKSNRIRPGEFVAALGSPLSLHKTATVGIVSSPLRGSNELGLTNKMEYIQTDAVIGLGNSGGPLVNMDGQAIGINSLKLTEGISFAIPSDYAFKLIDKAESLASKESNLPQKDLNKRRYMGITMLSLTPQIIMEIQNKIPEFPDVKTGVYVHKVTVSSPAYNGGLHAGDVIVDINGYNMATSQDVYFMVENYDDLKVTVIRGRTYEKFSVTTETIS